MPHRKRIVQVGMYLEKYNLFNSFKRTSPLLVGAPIEVTKCTNPSKKEVNELHQRFMEALVDLFETHKSKYLENSADLKLHII